MATPSRFRAACRVGCAHRAFSQRFQRVGVMVLLFLTIVSSATAKYSGGSGTAQNPYQIATAADLIALGETPADYDKHFLLTADIDLDPNLPGRKVFDRAVIAPDADPVKYDFQGTPFGGVFDGKGHTISHLTIKGGSYVGLFAQLVSGAIVKDLGVVDVNVTASGGYVGALAGSNGSWGVPGASVTHCYVTGRVNGGSGVGGLVGSNWIGTITYCHSAAAVVGAWATGGLVGENNYATVTQCCADGTVEGDVEVGGLIGISFGGTIRDCYSIACVSGRNCVGGLIGGGDEEEGWPYISRCYSAGRARGGANVGGLVGGGGADRVIASIWDTQTSGQATSAGGVGLTTAEMMDPQMLGLNGFANDPNWVLDAGRDYPRLAWEGTAGQIIPDPDTGWLQGQGTADDPYRVDTADQLIFLSRASALWDKHLVLGADIDLDPALPGRKVFERSPIRIFGGVFDGAGHVIAHLAITGRNHVGLFGWLGGEVKNLGVVDVNVTGSGACVGGLVGSNGSYETPGGTVTDCYSTGSVNGREEVGGLVGSNGGDVARCYSMSLVTGDSCVGGLVGLNGLRTGWGRPFYMGSVTQCYSTGAVSGTGWSIDGLVGFGGATASFYDLETSGQATSAPGVGKTTAEMQTAKTFLDAGWDFVGETKNGTEDLWWILEGKDYPRLWWEAQN